MTNHQFTVDEAAGEARLMIDDVELVLRADLPRIAAVSGRLGCKSLGDLVTRLTGIEAGATWAGIEFLTVKGDPAAALEKLKLRHFGDAGTAFATILAHQFDKPADNVVEAA